MSLSLILTDFLAAGGNCSSLHHRSGNHTRSQVLELRWVKLHHFVVSFVLVLWQKVCSGLVQEAVAAGAAFLALPECFNFIGVSICSVVIGHRTKHPLHIHKCFASDTGRFSLTQILDTARRLRVQTEHRNFEDISSSAWTCSLGLHTLFDILTRLELSTE